MNKVFESRNVLQLNITMEYSSMEILVFSILNHIEEKW